MSIDIDYKTLFKDLTIITFCISFCFYNLEILASNTILAFLTILWLGFWFQSLHLFVHEATHFNLHKNKKINDLFGNILSIFFMGLLIEDYRKKHWEHHKNLGKITDTENSYFSPINLKNIISYLTLINIFKKILQNFKKNKTNFSFNNNFIKKILIILLFALIHSANIILIFFSINLVGSVIYLLSFFIIYPFFAVIRQTLEHRSSEADDNINYAEVNHGEFNRLFRNNFFSRFFGSAGFNKHLLHHINPGISYTKFKELEKKLNESTKYKVLLEQSKSSYGAIFFKLFFKR